MLSDEFESGEFAVLVGEAQYVFLQTDYSSGGAASKLIWSLVEAITGR